MIEHTADTGIRAYGSSLAEVFVNCSLGMMSLMLDLATVGRSTRVALEAEARDRESLLVAWLAHILFVVETQGTVFGAFEIAELEETRAKGWGLGEAMDPARHRLELEIKAPTYHMLELKEEAGLWTAQVIFDV